MTAPATTRRAGPFNGNGTTTSFPFTFKVFATSDIAVIKTNADGLSDTLALGGDYSVTLNSDQDSNPGGTITHPISGTPLATGETLVAIGALPYDQTADLPSGGSFRANVIENALDRTVMQVQQLAEEVGRSLTLPPSAASANTELPSPEANKILGWNEAGDALVNLDASDLATVVVAGTSYTDIFNGTGAQTAFTLTANPGSVNALDVAISGVSQVNGVDFTISGTTLTFTSAPAAGTGNVVVRYVAAVPVGTGDAQDIAFNASVPPPIGTVARHLVEASVMVTDYPWLADKTGATDAAPAIQACIDFWAAKGATDGVIYRVRVPAGQYKLSSGIKTCVAATATGQVGLVGDGIFATRFLPTGNFTAVNLVTSYVQSGGFSVHWAAYGGTTSRVGVELASADAQVSQCLISDILVQNAGRGFYLADWTGQPYGTVYLLTMANCISIGASDWGMYLNSKTGSTTLELSGCYVNGGNGSGVAANKGFYLNNINEVTGEVAIDKCVDRWFEVVNANWCGMYIAAESCKLSTVSAVGVTINADRAEIRGMKDISCTYDAAGTVRVIGMGAGCRSLIVAGYSQQSATIGGGTTLFRVTLNAATSLLTITDDSVVPAQVQDNGFHANASFNGVRFTSLNIAPGYGTWPAGSVVRYLAPVVGGAEGVVSPGGGSPGTWYEFGNVRLQGSKVWDAPSVASGAQTSTTVTVTGAALGDLCIVSLSVDLQLMQLTGHVSAADTVTVVLRNGTAGAIDLASGTLRARVIKA